MFSLAGKTCVVTGASRGLGRGIALAFAEQGADVVLAARTKADLEKVGHEVEAKGRRAHLVTADITDLAQLQKIADAGVKAFGRVDVWVNNAGADILIGPDASLSAVEKLDRLLTVDLRGTILASWRAAELLAARPD
ncbi:MAG TPA: SDR family NAD(P)-dependent oxidoreductase, partial [Stellaceae bacterium]|nr:SDR family NAD(P)-dependent oxidoreductase [Stellaceae bacterium]